MKKDTSSMFVFVRINKNNQKDNNLNDFTFTKEQYLWISKIWMRNDLFGPNSEFPSITDC